MMLIERRYGVIWWAKRLRETIYSCLSLKMQLIARIVLFLDEIFSSRHAGLSGIREKYERYEGKLHAHAHVHTAE